MKKVQLKNFEKLEYTRKEQFNSLHINLGFSGEDVKKISVTSALENEGKSFIALNLLRTFAQNGKKAILVDADLRKSRLVQKYGAEVDGGSDIVGLMHYLAGKNTLEEVIYETEIPNAHIIFAGKTVANPVNLLKKERFDEALDKLAQEYDVVLVDTPPVQPVIDGVYVAGKCDGTLLVIRYAFASTFDIRDSKEQLIAAHANVIGSVINRVPYNTGKYYRAYNKYAKKYYKKRKGYGYGYGYGYGKYGGYGNYSRYGGYGRYGSYGTGGRYGDYSDSASKK